MARIPYSRHYSALISPRVCFLCIYCFVLQQVYSHVDSLDLSSISEIEYAELFQEHINSPLLYEQYSFLRLAFEQVPERLNQATLIRLAQLEELQLNFDDALEVYYYLYQRFENDSVIGLRTLYLMTLFNDERTPQLLNKFTSRLDLQRKELYLALILTIKYYEQRAMLTEAQEYYDSLTQSEFTNDLPATFYYYMYNFAESMGDTTLQAKAELLLNTQHEHSLETYLLFSPRIKPIPFLSEYLQLATINLEGEPETLYAPHRDLPSAATDTAKIPNNTSKKNVNANSSPTIESSLNLTTSSKAIQVAAFRSRSNALNATQYFARVIKDYRTQDSRYSGVALPSLIFYEEEGYYKVLFIIPKDEDKDLTLLLLRDAGIEGNFVEIN